MSYMLLIHEAVGQRATRTDEEGRALYDRMLRFGDALREEGVLLGAQSLAPQSRATRVRVEGGRARAVDGPFAEAKEMIGGFFHVDVATHEEAVAIAARCPAAEWATVEVRALAPCFEA
ncbi:YciI family protein [Massilia sp. Leaf139]|uniref:YciI family protein n=1 Tax=Massilia sp. Leaf139 TaxID=1736272 RepID=UPI0006F83B8A|nr:YciI family protein [Massilia sp. Leaf139]KQQ97298.1 dehydrogenase [Massilia sp. Leaf139]